MEAQRHFWRGLTALGLVGALALAAVILSGTGSRVERAEAQQAFCSTPSNFCLTITKETTSGNGNFRFLANFGQVPKQPAIILQPNDNFTLKQGESLSVPTNNLGIVEITEIVPDGWLLVDIDCAISSNVAGWIFFDEERVLIEFNQQDHVDIGSGELIPRTLGGESSAVCTFTNQPTQQPNVGGVFPAILGRPHATPTKAAAAATGGQTLAPPRTGEAGLVSDGDSSISLSLAFVALTALAFGGAGYGAIRVRRDS